MVVYVINLFLDFLPRQNSFIDIYTNRFRPDSLEVNLSRLTELGTREYIYLKNKRYIFKG